MAYYNIEQVTIHSAPVMAREGMTTIVARLRNPARTACVQIPDNVMKEIGASAGNFAPVLQAVYMTAMEQVLSAHVKPWSVTPASMPAAMFAMAALTDAIISSGSSWISKEELTEGWNKSATLRTWHSRADWQSNGALRKQVALFSDDVCKLSAKNAGVSKATAERILAKLAPADLDTGWGEFVARRCGKILEAQVEEITEDLL